MNVLKRLNSRCFVACTGAGLSVQQELWSEVGASEYLLGGVFPYSYQEVDTFLGSRPLSYCSKETSMEMAMTSYVRACGGSVGGAPMGIGITASVATETYRKGGERAHLTIITSDRVLYQKVDLQRGRGNFMRSAHDIAIKFAFLNLLESLLSDNQEQATVAAHTEMMLRPRWMPDGSRQQASPSGLYLPTSMDPLHHGHKALMEAAEFADQGPEGSGSYLVEVDPPHKANPTLQDLLSKVAAARADSQPIEFSSGEPLFLDKARARPGSVFAVGYDTALRLVDPSWGYNVSAMLNELDELGTVFIVAGRLHEGVYKTVESIPECASRTALFYPVPTRVDVSSTEIREAL